MGEPTAENDYTERCPSMDPYEGALRCERRVHGDDQHQYQGIAWTTPRTETAQVDEVRDLLNRHGVIETYSGLLGVVIQCRTCGEIAGSTPLDALRRHDLAVLDANRLLSLPPGGGSDD